LDHPLPFLLLGYGNLVQFGGGLLLGIGIPYLFLTRGYGYDKGEFGLRKEKSRDAWWLFSAGLAWFLFLLRVQESILYY